MPTRARPLIALLVAGTLACGTAFSQNTQTATEPEAGIALSNSEGLRAYLDPATGRLIDHPPYGKPTLRISSTALERFSTSHFGLIEQVLPNGLRLVHLRGRFRQGSVATVNDDGTVKVERIGPEIFLSPAGFTLHKRIESAEQNKEVDHE